MNTTNQTQTVEPSRRHRVKGSPVIVPVSTFKLPAEGWHPATIVAVMDVGTHRTKAKGFPLQQVVIGFELADERRRDGDPIVINVFFPMWPDEGSPLYQLIAQLKGEDAVEELIHNLGELCGEPCSVEVVHVEKKNGRMKAEINSNTIDAPDCEVPPPISTLFDYSASSDKMHGAAWDLLPEFVQSLIGTCEEVMHPVIKQNGSAETSEASTPETKVVADSETDEGEPDIEEINRRLQNDVFGGDETK